MPGSSRSIYRGAVVNVLAAVLFLLAASGGDLAKAKTFPAWVSVLVLFSFVSEPVLTWFKMDAVLGRNPGWATHRFRPVLVNLFSVLLFWGARLAFFGALVVTALKGFVSEEIFRSLLLPLLLVMAVREGFLVACYCRTGSRRKIGSLAEWGIDLGLVVTIGIAEALAFGLFDVVRAPRIEFPEVLYLLLFQLMFFVMFFLPIRMPYTIEEIAGRGGSVKERAALWGSFALTFAGLFYGPMLFR